MRTLLVLLIGAAIGLNSRTDAADPASLRAVTEAMDEGNWAEALALAEARLSSGDAARSDLENAVTCLNRLGRMPELDALVEGVAKRYADDSGMLLQCGIAYWQAPDHGVEIAGEFRRGERSGSGETLNVGESDRVRSLRLYRAAIVASDDDRLIAEACDHLAYALANGRMGRQAWRLQSLTDLEDPPPPSRGWRNHAPGSDPPVDEAGTPLLYESPAEWDDAASDGERWRWALAERARRDPSKRRDIELAYANFLHDQFGVRTLAGGGFFPAERDGDRPSDEASVLAIETLGDEETIARLATGVRRFTLPEGHRFIDMYREHGEWQRLHGVWLDRRQRGKAAGAMRKAIENESNDTRREQLQAQLDQIVKPWAWFESVKTQPAGEGARLRLRSRNTGKAELTARRIDVARLLADVEALLEDPPPKIPNEQLQIERLGWRLVHDGQEKYLGEEVAGWSAEIDERGDHADSQTAIASPLQEAGAYWVEARVEGGAPTRVVVWLADTALVRKRARDGALFQTLDARHGAPIPGAKLSLFGYRWVHPQRGEPFSKPRLETRREQLTTDDDGVAELRLAADDQGRYEWVATATTDQGRQAHLGFNRLWRSGDPAPMPDKPRVFLVTDRPVYRPGHRVEFKAWVARPSYAPPEEEPTSEFAHQSFQVRLTDARGEKVWSERLTADTYGGLIGSYDLPEGAPLGAWRLEVVGFGGESFRVEEYRKPEFEVAVDAPEEPTRLGEPFEAVVRADYYYGAPVRQGTVKYKVTRQRKQDRWLPPGAWDWLYGRGYGWLGQDATWRSDWALWGCPGPRPFWWPVPSGPPEVVAEGEAALDASGEFRLEIETDLAKERFPNDDHQYTVTAEVTDASRRVIVGTGRVLAARRPIDVSLWLDRGHYDVDQTVRATISTRRPDGAPLAGPGELRLLRLTPPEDPSKTDDQGRLPEETETLVESWVLATDAGGRAEMRVKASEPGRYRLVYASDAAGGEKIEGGALFTIRGPGFDGSGFRFGAIELTPDKPEYAPGETVRLMIGADRADSTVSLFIRPEGSVYTRPQLVKLVGKSAVIDLPVTDADQPNIFVEALTVSDGEAHRAVRQIVVPPATRVLRLEASPSEAVMRPGQGGTIKLRLTDEAGEPVVGQATIAIYDRSVEAIAGGPVGGDLRKRFWDWKRSHRPHQLHNLSRTESAANRRGEPVMQMLGVFGHVADSGVDSFNVGFQRQLGRGFGGGGDLAFSTAAVPASAPMFDAMTRESAADTSVAKEADGAPAPTVRENFADTALWVGAVETDKDGLAVVPMTMPESLTAWKARVWVMAPGVRVAQAEAELVTRKDLMVRLQTPRFLVERDEAVFSAIVNNESGEAATVRVRLELEGDAIAPPSTPEKTVRVGPRDEALVEWRVSAQREGEAVVRVVADGGELTDAMQRRLPVLVHGAERVESFSAVIGTDDRLATFELIVPEKRRPEATRLEARYAPTLVGAMLDTLPYLIEYPHGCTEQTLNRFLPAVLVRKTLDDLGVDLEELKGGEQGPLPPERQEMNPVHDSEELDRIVRRGVRRLERMQLADGGWGWFSGLGEQSSAHTTAVVVRGLLQARESGVEIPDRIVDRGLDWLEAHRAEQLRRLANVKEGRPIDRNQPWKQRADNLDMLVELTLAEGERPDRTLRQRLFDDRLSLAPYGLAMLGFRLHLEAGGDGKQAEEAAWLRDRTIRNLRQFVKQDDQLQTAWLDLPGGGWWYWYGSEHEAHAFFLKLLAATEPKGELAPRLVKHLLANRRHATRWNSTRDTALVVEAMADYLRESGEAAVGGTVEVWLDGQRRDELEFTAEEALMLEGRFTLAGDEIDAGRHTLELRKKGAGRLYVGASLSNFTLEDDIRAAGLELTVARRVQKLVPIEAEAQDVDSRGGVVNQRVERYRRVDVPNLGEVESGDLVEVELTIRSKNDYEYLVIEDPKAAGFEPVETRSGYNGNPIGAYVEYRDERVLLYTHWLPQGEHTVRYRLRAETPGRFSALPTQARAMYAPELRGNSDENKVGVTD